MKTITILFLYLPLGIIAWTLAIACVMAVLKKDEEVE